MSKRPLGDGPAVPENASKSWLTWPMSVTGLGLFLAVFFKAILGLDTSWDSIWYHLPFAALRIGILDARDYQLSGWVKKAYYDAFPVLADFLQGALWRLSGRVQSANLIGLIGIALLSVYLKRRHSVPLFWTITSVLTVPLVLIHASGAYVDLFCNCFFAISLLCLFDLLIRPSESPLVTAAIFLGTGVVSANSKLTFVPLVVLASAVFLIAQLRSRRHFKAAFFSVSRSRRFLFVGLIFALTCGLFFNSVKNTLRFGNPLFPVRLSLGALHLPGMVSVERPSPSYLADAPSGLRWALSVLEFDAFGNRPGLWTCDQGDVLNSSHAYRMGGYFGAFVVFSLFFLFSLRSNTPRREWQTAVWAFVVVSCITSILPAAHELRYYSYWILLLVALNLILLFRAEANLAAWKLCYVCVVLSMTVFVQSATGLHFVTPRLISSRQISDAIAGDDLKNMDIALDETICVDGRDGKASMYSPLFQTDLAKSLHYHIKEVYDPADCGFLRLLIKTPR